MLAGAARKIVGSRQARSCRKAGVEIKVANINIKEKPEIGRAHV